MNKAKATKVLREVEEQFKLYIEAGYPKPNLRDADHEGQSKGSWSIEWEDGPDEWCYAMPASKIPGVFVEPIYSFILGVYDD